MESKEELINNLKEREEYLEGELYQLRDLAINPPSNDDRDIKDLISAMDGARRALNAVRRIIDRNK